MNNIGFGEQLKEHIMLLPFTDTYRLAGSRAQVKTAQHRMHRTGRGLCPRPQGCGPKAESNFWFCPPVPRPAGNASRWALTI
jgi:hypothetical protein